MQSKRGKRTDMDRNIDYIDMMILDKLQEEGRISIVQLAEHVNLTKTPCAERVKRLERAGFIQGYSAQVDPHHFGLNQLTVVHVSMTSTSSALLKEFRAAVSAMPEIECCLMISGNFDFMLQLRTKDVSELRDVLGEKISGLPGVLHTHSFTVIETVKDQSRLSIEQMRRC